VIQRDFLVIGGGIAGLTFALEAAKHGSVAVLFKKELENSSTSWAQGGIAAVQTEEDNFDLHKHDTMIAGAGLCKEEIVDIVVREGPERIAGLVQHGAQFDKAEGSDAYDLTREGGHSIRRILHSADSTGYEIQRTLLSAATINANIEFFTHASAIDLITTRKHSPKREAENNRVLGAYILRQDGKVEPFLGKRVLVATGGAGKIYRYTTNPDIATGDGIAMCFRAGARVANLEFFQFHPTCLYHPELRSFLITEAMRGEGGKLRRTNGERFMDRYHPMAELAPRDVVARAIDSELKTHGEEHVLLDMTHLPADFIRERFPMIHQRCLSIGLDITTTPIPVVPAAHYCCGGVVSNAHGETDIQGLYVAGEVAHTGLHGANRLASNSLLEGVVFGYRAAQAAIESVLDTPASDPIPDWESGSARNSDEEVVITQTWSEIRRFMWNYVGIERTNKRLERALHRSNLIQKEIHEYYWNFHVTPELLELRNLSLVANLLIHCAIRRHESRGLHFTIDYPKTSVLFERDTEILPAEYFHYCDPAHY
jgi:L-aspartate oxidase